MRSPLEDTIWGNSYGSTGAVRAAFDRFGPDYHRAIMESGVPQRAAEAISPHLSLDGTGIDLGCGSGVLGLSLRACGFHGPLDGVDLSPGMLDLARMTACYRDLFPANLLLPDELTQFAHPYNFVITVGLVGDYVPHYVALPYAAGLICADGIVAFAVESRSTPWHALERQMSELRLNLISETILEVPEARLTAQTYHLFVTQRVTSSISPPLAGP